MMRAIARHTLLWLESGSCSGESMALLGAEGPGKGPDNLLDFMRECDVQLLWHPSVSHETPRELMALIDRIRGGLQPLTMLCIEGSIIHGPGGTGMYDTFAHQPKKDLIRSLCDHADYVLAMGTCAAFGGIPAAPPNPTESTGLQFTNDVPGGLLPAAWRSRSGKPVVNLPGCPVDAATMIQTMTPLLLGCDVALDRYQRAESVGPCLSHGQAERKKCGTGDQVGYACYGCLGTRFPLGKALFRHVGREVEAGLRLRTVA
jgi:uptake hydrogenase small subunit